MGGSSSSNHQVIPDQQRQTIESEQSDLQHLIENRHYAPGFDPENSNHRLFFRSFDGTWNNQNNLETNDRGQPIEQPTNPAILRELISPSSQISSEYIEGVGTEGSEFQRTLEGVSGEGVIERAEDAYNDFRDTVTSWHAEDPHSEVFVSMAGFSRGTISARHFANIVYERGVPAVDAEVIGQEFIGYSEGSEQTGVPLYRDIYDNYIIAPEEVNLSSAVLFDSVSAGQEYHANLHLPPVPNFNVLHITANHELRDQFDLQSVRDLSNPNDPRILEVGFSGVHSDIGGSYLYDYLSSQTLDLAHGFLSANNVPISSIPSEYQRSLDEVGQIHDNDQWYYTQIGDREIEYANNPQVQGEIGLTADEIENNQQLLLDYLDGSIARTEGLLEWARANSDSEEASVILSQSDVLSNNIEKLTENRDQLIQHTDVLSNSDSNVNVDSDDTYVSIVDGREVYTRPDGREYVIDSDTNEVVYLDEEGDVDESGEASYVGENGDSGLFSGVDGGEVESAARNLSQLLQAIEGNDTLGSVLNALDLYQDFVDLSEEGRDHDVDGLDTAVSLSSFFYYSIKKRSKKSETCLPALRVPCAFQKNRVFGNSPNLRFASDSPNPDPIFSAMLGGIQGELVAYRWAA